MVRPLASIGKYLSFCAFEPPNKSGSAIPLPFSPAITESESEKRAISSRAMHSMVSEPAGPPYSSGTLH